MEVLCVLRYEALVEGKMESAVEYREKFYVFKSNQEQDMFLRCGTILFADFRNVSVTYVYFLQWCFR